MPHRKLLLYPRAARLHFLPVSMCGVAVGAAYAARAHALEPWRVALAGLLIASTHAAANLINDYGDSRSGADWIALERNSLHGGSKLIQRGVLGERWYRRAAFCTYLFAALLLIIFAFAIGPHDMLPIGLLIFLWSHQYTMPPLHLAYRGLGELSILVLFGPATVCGTYVLVTGAQWNVPALLLGCVCGVWAALVLLCNECADRETDRVAHKRTLAVRVPPRPLALLIGAVVALAIVATVYTRVPCVLVPVLLQAVAGTVIAVLIWHGTRRAVRAATRTGMLAFALVTITLAGCLLGW